MELKLGLHVIETILGYLEKDHGLLAVEEVLTESNEFQGLHSKLKSITGDLAIPPVPPSTKGFSVSGTEFLLDGQPFRFTGYNMRELAFYLEGLPDTHTDLGFLHDQLRWAKHELGGKVVRFYAAYKNYPVERSIPLVKRTLDFLQEYGLYAILVLTDGVGSGYSIPDTPQNFQNRHTHDFYAGGYRQNYLPYITTMLKAVGDHPALFMVEPGNEFLCPFPPFVPAPPTEQQYRNILNFFKDASDNIRTHTRVPIGTGAISAWELFADQAYGGLRLASELYKLPNIDAASVHTYEGQRTHKWGDTGMHLASELNLTGHPLYIGETGLDTRHATIDGGFTVRLGTETSHRVRGLCQWALTAGTARGISDSVAGMNMWQPQFWHHYVGGMKHLAQNIFR